MEKKHGPRGLLARDLDDIYDEVAHLADLAEEIRARGPSTTPRQELRRKRILGAMIKNLRYAKQRERGE
ncbi:hypothetical protein ACFLZP_05145 [Patescibacteria group bacterium]